MLTGLLTSSELDLSWGLCGVGGDRDCGGVCGGSKSGNAPLLALWRGDWKAKITKYTT
jgi:hypothetical protein